jgi:hypothetical protein
MRPRVASPPRRRRRGWEQHFWLPPRMRKLCSLAGQNERAPKRPSCRITAFSDSVAPAGSPARSPRRPVLRQGFANHRLQLRVERVQRALRVRELQVALAGDLDPPRVEILDYREPGPRAVALLALHEQWRGLYYVVASARHGKWHSLSL